MKKIYLYTKRSPYRIIIYVLFLSFLLSPVCHCHPLDNRARDFELTSIQGKAIKLSDYQGKTVVLVFWAFWCDTWKDVAEGFDYLSRDFSPVPFRYLVVAVDPTRKEIMTKNKKEIPFPVLIDEKGAVSRLFEVRRVPTVIIIDGEGKIRYRGEGYPGNKKLKEILWRILKEN